MSYEDELEALQREALEELQGGDYGSDTDDSEFEESTDTSDYDGENEEDGNDFRGDEEEDDFSDDNEELDEEDREEESDFKPLEVEIAGGQKISINSQDELMAFVKKGAQSLENKQQRRSENDQIVEQGRLSKEDLTLLIDAKNGNPAAIAKLAKQAKVDIYDLDENLADSYQPEFTPQIMSEADEVANEIMQDSELHDQFKRVIKLVPQDFAARVATSPDALRNFSRHIKSGLAQKVIPEALKAQLLEGGDFMEHYAKIGREMSSNSEQKKEEKEIRKTNPRADELRKRAQKTRGKNETTKTSQTGDDIWAMSSEDFNNKFMGA